ncbi:MAG: TlpA disulfide reductase family protein [candidate division Zixibacteria bacterium]|nr:TlpA disulfide reductase family protein [candidate division Zixibacteria bacterium]
MKKTLLILPAAAIIAAALLWPGCGSKETGKASNGGAVQTVPDKSERFVLDDVFNRKRKWSEFVGKPLVINFWATWCPPCRMEMPVLKKLYQEYKPKGLEIVGISVDDSRNPVMPFIQQMQIPWVILYGDKNVSEEFKMGRGIPVTIFFDATGKEIGRVTGAQPESLFRSYFDQMVGVQAKS